MKDLFIVGAGGFGREAVWTVERINAASQLPLWRVIGFADDDPTKASGNFEGYPLLGSVEKAEHDYPGASVFIAIGGTDIGKFVIINARAGVGHDSKVGDFSNVCPGVSLSGHTELADHVFMGTNSCTAPNMKVGSRATVACGTPVLKDVEPGTTLSPFGTLKNA